MLSRDTRVFPVVLQGGTQHWLIEPSTKRDPNTGRIILWPSWGKPSEARPMVLEYAEIFRRRYQEEHHIVVHFALSPGSTDFVEEQNGSSPSNGEDERKPMQYRGLIAVPGHDVKNDGQKCWFVRIYENGMQRDSVRGATVQEVVDNVFERNLQALAEKSAVQQAPPPAVQTKVAGPRIRPGSFRR